MSSGFRSAGWLLGVLGMVGIGALSRFPLPVNADDSALVRLSWRLRGEVVESCRTLTAEELGELPPHMRAAEVCKGRTSPYRLVLEVDGEPRLDEIVETSAARGDRLVVVFREVLLRPGPHEVEVRFVPVDPEAASSSLTYRGEHALAPRGVLLVTVDAQAGALVSLPDR